MEVILLGIYGFFVWLIFYKFKWLPMNFVAACIVITLPIVAMMALFLLLNISAPASDDVRAMNYIIPIVPRVTGSGDRGADLTKPADQERRRAFQDRPGAL